MLAAPRRRIVLARPAMIRDARPCPPDPAAFRLRAPQVPAEDMAGCATGARAGDARDRPGSRCRRQHGPIRPPAAQPGLSGAGLSRSSRLPPPTPASAPPQRMIPAGPSHHAAPSALIREPWPSTSPEIRRTRRCSTCSRPTGPLPLNQPMSALTACRSCGWTAPFVGASHRIMVKVNTQGYEQQVLNGGPQTIAAAVAVQLELSLAPL